MFTNGVFFLFFHLNFFLIVDVKNVIGKIKKKRQAKLQKLV